MRDRRAFTLLELLLVLALLAIMAAFSWPALRGSMGGQSLRSAGDQVRTLWLRARTKAITSGETMSFRYQPGTGKYRVEQRTEQQLLLAAFSASSAGAGQQAGGGAPSAAGQSATPPAPLSPVEHQLPEGVTFAGSEVTADSRAARLAAEERVRSMGDGTWSEAVLFYPDGTATAAQVALVGARGRAITVELRSLTGDVRVGPIVSLEELQR